MALKQELVASLGEFVGTFLFLFMAFAGTQVANSPSSTTANAQGPQPINILYIAISFGFSLAVNAWVFFRISGGLFNPAVTLGLGLVGAFPPLRGLILFFTQIVAGIAASAVVSGILPGDKIIFGCTLEGGTSIAQGLFIEMFLTAQLLITIFMLAAEKHKATYIAPVGIGLALFISEIAGVYYTGGALNPARAFGPAVIAGSFPGYHWIYWLGPILGSLLATGFYKLMIFLDYENANPGQDKSYDPEASPAEVDKHSHHHRLHHHRHEERGRPLPGSADPNRDSQHSRQVLVTTGQGKSRSEMELSDTNNSRYFRSSNPLDHPGGAVGAGAESASRASYQSDITSNTGGDPATLQRREPRVAGY